MRGKLLKWILALAALSYLGCCIFLYARQRDLLYFPQGTRAAASTTDFSLRRPDAVLRGWVVNPGQSRAVLYFGGNGEAIEQARTELAHDLPSLTVYLLAYRGYGASDGEPEEALLFADALALYDEVAPHHTGIGAIGRSLGSGVATYLASRRAIDRLALVTPYDSIARLAQEAYPMFPVTWLLQDRYESWRYAGDVNCPVLVVSATQDEVIPATSTDALIARFPATPQRIRIADAHHNTVQQFPAYGDALARFLGTAAAPVGLASSLR
jgi:pimeloyl-ACP methyl ester carboxylesterase